jgi:hypothetical protein
MPSGSTYSLPATRYSLLPQMLPATLSILRDPVPYHGAIGFFAFTTLERLNAYVGLMVGVATLVYLCLRIRREIRDRNANPAPED